jgi:SWI/SNF-related matrix-associated actin-dependent regulator 1 of chromatin subfamily A
MDNSQLYQSKFDLVIIDEAHRLSNTTSGIFKIVSDLLGRSNPKGIYAITGTPITNRPINFFNILKIIDAPLANDWKYYVERYCDGRWFYNKKERDAYSAIFCRKKKKENWYALTDEEKEELDEILDKNCKKIWVTDGSSNLDELQEVVKPYYLRRLKSDFGKIVKKTVKVLNYKLTNKEREEYDGVWDEYLQAQEGKGKEDIDKYKRITEGIMLRQWLAKSMTKKTIKLAEKCINLGHKVVIFCSFDEELNTIKEHFGKLCVVHNGKLTMKRKNDSVEKFQNDPNVKVFIGNIQSAGVGLTLVASRVAIFNSFSWVSGDNLQAEDRIHRLNQKNDVTIYYQVYSDTFYKEMLEKVRGKQEIIDNIIVSESEK